MTRSKKLRVLREVWASMPSVECKGLCVANCSTVPIMPIELELLEQTLGRKVPTTPLPYEAGKLVALGEVMKPCPLLVLGRCSAHEVRPVICRAYGAAEGLSCPHGCTSSRTVPNDEQFALFAKVEAL